MVSILGCWFQGLVLGLRASLGFLRSVWGIKLLQGICNFWILGPLLALHRLQRVQSKGILDIPHTYTRMEIFNVGYHLKREHLSDDCRIILKGIPLYCSP